MTFKQLSESCHKLDLVKSLTCTYLVQKWNFQEPINADRLYTVLLVTLFLPAFVGKES